jgi:hypothetical protein
VALLYAVCFSVGHASPAKSLSLSTDLVAFGIEPVNTVGTARSITLANTGTSSLKLAGITSTSEFALSSNCGTTLAVGATCTLLVSLAPLSAGPKTGTLSVMTDASAVPDIISLAGLAALPGSQGSSGQGPSVMAGWNLLGNGTTAPLDVVSAFGDGSKVTSVWKWVPAAKNWAFYTPAEMDGGAAHAASHGYDFLRTVNAGEGFWLNAKKSVAFQLPTAPYLGASAYKGKLPSGWNLIAVGDNQTPGAISKALYVTPSVNEAAAFDLNSLWAWDNALSRWYFYASSLDQSGELGSFIQTRSYLDFSNKTMEPTTGFWTSVDGTVVPGTSITISGRVAKAQALAGALVSAYALKADGSKDFLLPGGSTLSDADGRFTLALATLPNGPVLLEASGGNYKSGYSGKELASTAAVSALIERVADSAITSVAITPLSDMAVARARALLANGSYTSLIDASLAAQQLIALAYGLKASPNLIVPKFDAPAVTSDPWGTQMAMVLLALDTLAHRASPADPDAIYPLLSADIADGRFDGKNETTTLTLNHEAVAPTIGSQDYFSSVALAYSATTSGLRPAYVEAHIKAGSIVENYEAKIVPVYVASSVKQYVPSPSLPLAKVTHVQGNALGYSCNSGSLHWSANFNPNALESNTNQSPVCSLPHYSCGGVSPTYSASYDAWTGKPEPTCPDGGIVMYQAATLASYKAPSVVAYTAASISTYTAPVIEVVTSSTVDPYSASTLSPFSSALTIGVPQAGTVPVYTATIAHVFTQAERAAMAANDAAAGDAAAAKISALGPLNIAQINALHMINDAILISSGLFTYR